MRRIDGIWRFTLHIEKHPGYPWHIRLRRKPKPGTRVPEGTLVPCGLCSGDGMLLLPDEWRLKETRAT